MHSNELKTSLGRAAITKLKALGSGIQVGKVMGRRILVKLVESYTDMDRVEKEGTLYIPKTVRDANQPLPSTGVIVKLGEEFAYTDTGGLAEGDMIMFSRFAGTDFRVDEQNFRILEENEIMCTLIDTEQVVTPISEGVDGL